MGTFKQLRARVSKFLNTEYSGNIKREAIPDKQDLPIGDLRSTPYDLTWVDEFVDKIKKYVYVREADNLLILIPNQVYRLNRSGVSILRFLMDNNSIKSLLVEIGNTEEKRRELHYFFCDLRAVVSGCLRENEKREAVSYYEFSGDQNQYPVLSEIAATYRCNLKCEFCYVGHKSQMRELGTADTKKILFKIFNEAHVPSVSFTGGEPLLRKDIVELVEYATGIGLWTNLITNATLLDHKLVHELKRAGLSSTQVSIEGPGPDIHDRITGVPGSFEKTLKGIEMIADAGIPVHTNTTVSNSNAKHLKDIVCLVKKLGMSRFSMNLLIPCGAAAAKKDLWISYAEIGDRIIELKRFSQQENVKFLWYSPVPVCMFNPIAHGLGNKSCAAITGLLSIDPMGNVLPCSSWPEPVGSLLKKRFKDIWNSPMLAYFKHREYAPQECRQCTKLDICKGACPLYWKAQGGSVIIGWHDGMDRPCPPSANQRGGRAAGGQKPLLRRIMSNNYQVGGTSSPEV